MTAQVVEFEAVIGADGVFDIVRKRVVPKNEWMGMSSGFWDCRNLISYDFSKVYLEGVRVRQIVWDGPAMARTSCTMFSRKG